MTDMDALREALRGMESALPSDADTYAFHSALQVIVAAAGVYAEGEKMNWCDEHRAMLLSTDRETGEQFCWKHHINFLPSKVPYNACRMVRVLICPAAADVRGL